MAEPTKPVMATETVIVHDDNLNIDRRVILGQPVPPDLIDAYREKVGDKKADEAPADAGDEDVTANAQKSTGRSRKS